MGCACGGSTTRSAASAQQTARRSGLSAYVWRVTYNDGNTQDFSTEQEAIGALSFKGGAYTSVPRGS